jgi:hypothetical protein
MLNTAVAVFAGLLESVTLTVKLGEVPVTLGVPVIAPVEAFSVAHAGRLPLEMLQV